MQRMSQEPIIIDLDDPTPRWSWWCGVLAALAFIALLVAPWVIDSEVTPQGAAAEITRPQGSTTEYAAICQPSIDIPAFAEPVVSMALPSWMRLCDWFAEPGEHLPGTIPTPPPARPDVQG